ncbi:hypothetical protein [Oleiagrimonas soli]|uniref:Copper-binding protein n=1 Tax=Oleiagrimonas soli TaxID=1543381 RepID=A0A099CVE3_9GAMM|nr:hypothetical protein [Oleiagrimonas soli]KGI76985.1 hypothetical protein LF63_0111970 [Oleiagrimonas soli]MBB6185508.1 hypothetical protein [Oleiagrimonas soli]
MRKHLSLIALTLFTAMSLALAAQASAPAASGPGMQAGKNMMDKTPMMGEHTMPGTVTSVDHKTGIVKVTSLGMPLVVHFPPPSIAQLKAGDRIDLHLGYRVTGH